MPADDSSVGPCPILVAAGVQRVVYDALIRRYAVLGPLAGPLATSLAQLDAERLAAVRVLVTLGSSETSRAALAVLPNVGLIACTGSGYDGIDRLAARERGIWITNSPAVTAASVADLALALLIASIRRVPEACARVREGDLARPLPATFGLTGRRVGIFGLGAVGSAIARRLVACDTEIGYCNRRPRADVPYRYFESLLRMAEWADALIVTAPATPRTHAAVSSQVLAALGARGHLVNVARSSIVDTAALCDALERGGIAGAALDVFDSAYRARLQTLPNALLTPHIGGVTQQAEAAMRDAVLANVQAFLDGRTPLTPVRE